jgi:5-methylcytosine-specific restriction endonuclease McrA
MARRFNYNPNWAATQKSDKQKLGGVCEVCGHPGSRDNPVQRHHILGKAKGQGDALIGLKLLCKRHHDKLHGRF